MLSISHVSHTKSNCQSDATLPRDKLAVVVGVAIVLTRILLVGMELMTMAVAFVLGGCFLGEAFCLTQVSE